MTEAGQHAKARQHDRGKARQHDIGRATRQRQGNTTKARWDDRDKAVQKQECRSWQHNVKCGDIVGRQYIEKMGYNHNNTTKGINAQSTEIPHAGKNMPPSDVQYIANY